MRKFTIIVFAFFSLTANGQELAWANAYKFLSPNMSLAVAADGSVYLAGFDRTREDIDPGPGVLTIPGPSGPPISVGFLAKFDSTGQAIWVRSIGGPSVEMSFSPPVSDGSPSGHRLEIGPDGLLHVLFQVDLSLNSTVWVYPSLTDTVQVPAAGSIVATFDPTGDCLNIEPILGSATCYATDLCTLPDGRLTVVGYFSGDFFPNLPDLKKTSMGGLDGFILQFDPLSNDFSSHRTWQVGGTSEDKIFGADTDAAGNAVLCGSFKGTFDAAPSDTVQTFLQQFANSILSNFLLKIDPDGQLAWAQRIESGGSLKSRVAVDRALGRIAVTTNSASGNLVTLKAQIYEPLAGALESAFVLGSVDLQTSPLEVAQIRFDAAGALHVVRAEKSITTNNSEFVYQKFSPSEGAVLGGFRIAGQPRAMGLGLATGKLNEVLVAGWFEGTVDLDPGPDTLWGYSNVIGQSSFFLKFNETCPDFGLLLRNFVPIGCGQNGSAEAVLSGGAMPYSFEWATQPPQFDSIATFTKRGFFGLLARDGNGCERQSTFFMEGVENSDTTFFDLAARPLVVGEFRPGFNSKIVFSAVNKGCKPVNGTVKIALDPKLVLMGVTPAPAWVTGDTLVWAQPNWTIDDLFLADLQVYLPASVPLGDTICLLAKVETDEAETLLSNNIQIQKSIVIGSYDPNDIAADPPGVCAELAILPTQKLTYTIRFQNTGTASAIRVEVRDTLPAGFDIHTLRVLAASHAVVVERLDSTVLAFIFDNINLPDSASNEAASQGFVQFELSQKPDLSIGTVLENRAAIYFDFNAPIITNTVFRTIADPLPSCPPVSAGDLVGSKAGFSVSPNPIVAGDFLHITLENDFVGRVKFDILSLDGRVLETFFHEKTNHRMTQSHSVASVPASFFVRVSDGKTSVTRLVFKW